MPSVQPLKPDHKPRRRSVSGNAQIARPSATKGSHAAPVGSGNHALPPGPGGQAGGSGLTRRHFVIGGSVAAAAVAVTGVTLGIRARGKKKAEEDDFTGIRAEEEKFTSLKPTADQIDDVFDFGEIEPGGVVSEINSFDVDINCVITANESMYATALVPANSRETLVRIARIGLISGNMEVVLEKAISADENYEIYDARSNEDIMVWVEVEILSGNWRVYMGEMNEYLLGEPRLLDEGDGLYDPPWICVCKDAAVWAVMPDAKGEASDQDTLVKACTYNEKEPETLYVSHGRLCCNPQASEGILTITPRVDSMAIYYRLAAIDIAKRKLLADVVLPKSMAASEAVYQSGMFTFCIEQTYDFGEAIGTYGTYLVRTPTDLVQLYRAPTTAPAWCGEWLMVKSTQSVLGINPDKRHYFVIDAPVGCANYGEFLATAGKADHIVTYTTIASSKGDGSGVTRVRVFETAEDPYDPTPKGAGASLDEQKAAEEISTVQE